MPLQLFLDPPHGPAGCLVNLENQAGVDGFLAALDQADRGAGVANELSEGRVGIQAELGFDFFK